MKLRAISFIYNLENNKFLLLHRTKFMKPLRRKGYPIYEQVYEGERCEISVERGIREQIGLSAIEIFSLNWGAVQRVSREEFKDMNFLVFAEYKDSIPEGEWLDIDSFIKKIYWNDNKILLKKVLEKAIKREVFFDKKERGQ